MRIQLHLPSAVLGALALACVLAVVAFASPPQAAAQYEYKIASNPEEADVRALASQGYEYVGYLGKNKRGSTMDDILWRRAK